MSNKNKILKFEQIKNFLICSYGIPNKHPLLTAMTVCIESIFQNLREVKPGDPYGIDQAWKNYHTFCGVILVNLSIDNTLAGYHRLKYSKMHRLQVHLSKLIIQRYKYCYSYTHQKKGNDYHD